MYLHYQEPKSQASFILSDHINLSRAFRDATRHLKFFWNKGQKDVALRVDDKIMLIGPGHIFCCTYLQHITFEEIEDEMIVLFFNREFYCVHTHDKETSCNGLLFFGSNEVPYLKLNENETEKLSTLINVLYEEFTIKDANQEEMLRILLKRFIIRCTRMAKEQLLKTQKDDQEIDLIRQFNILVEEHFWTKKSVGEYADLLFKSPKTIANVFRMYSEATPLQLIHERIILEAKRMLLFTDHPIKHISNALGYEDTAQFSKFFKKYVGENPSQFQLKRKEFRM